MLSLKMGVVGQLWPFLWKEDAYGRSSERNAYGYRGRFKTLK